MSKVSALSNLTGPPADGDEFHIVDVSDTTDDAGGSSKALTITELMSFHRPACYTHSGSTNITSTAAVCAFDTETLDPEGAYSVSAGVITVDEAGYYSISYSVPINDDGTTGGIRARMFGYVERNTGGGYSTITQSRAQDYAREDSGGEGISASFVAQLTAGDLIRLMLDQSGTVDVSTESGEAQLSIFRIC